MQTFLPYPDFRISAKCLDYRRLGKQRVEVLQLLNALRGESKGWRNHPAAIMWEGCEHALVIYGIIMCDEWIVRGYTDTIRDKLEILDKEYNRDFYILPSWIFDDSFHASHRSNLLRKDKEWYSQFGWKEPNNLPYVWPKNKRMVALAQNEQTQEIS